MTSRKYGKESLLLVREAVIGNIMLYITKQKVVEEIEDNERTTKIELTSSRPDVEVERMTTERNIGQYM